jgi:hypothetical protein
MKVVETAKNKKRKETEEEKEHQQLTNSGIKRRNTGGGKNLAGMDVERTDESKDGDYKNDEGNDDDAGSPTYDSDNH